MPGVREVRAVRRAILWIELMGTGALRLAAAWVARAVRLSRYVRLNRCKGVISSFIPGRPQFSNISFRDFAGSSTSVGCNTSGA